MNTSDAFDPFESAQDTVLSCVEKLRRGEEVSASIVECCGNSGAVLEGVFVGMHYMYFSRKVIGKEVGKTLYFLSEIDLPEELTLSEIIKLISMRN